MLHKGIKPYTGHHHHTNSELILTWYRAYDPELGRWLSRDPIEEVSGQVAELLPEGPNLYLYADSNPIIGSDEYGLALPLVPLAIKGAALLGAAAMKACKKAPKYPKNPDDWIPPKGWKETPAGVNTGGKHRQWIDENGKIQRRWDREGREAGKERGPHWHDMTDKSCGNDHIEDFDD